MLVSISLFTISLIFLYLLTKHFTQFLFTILYTLTKRRWVTVWIVAVILLPGTILHEASHFLTALLLGVPTGLPHIRPDFASLINNTKAADEKSGEVVMGSVAVVKTDPVRRTLIGLAPFLVGLMILYVLGGLIGHAGPFALVTHMQPVYAALLSYLFFAVSTTMFASRKDLESFFITAPVAFVIGFLLYQAGVRILLAQPAAQSLSRVFSNITNDLLTSLMIISGVLAILTLTRMFWRKIGGHIRNT